MSLKVVNYEGDNQRGNVIVESDLSDWPLAIQEVQSMPSRKLAVEHAVKLGMADPSVNGNISYFPVDTTGEVVIDSTKQRIYRYRGEIPIIKKMI